MKTHTILKIFLPTLEERTHGADIMDDIMGNIKAKKLEDLATTIKKAADKDSIAMDAKWVENLTEKRWFILYGGPSKRRISWPRPKPD